MLREGTRRAVRKHLCNSAQQRIIKDNAYYSYKTGTDNGAPPLKEANVFFNKLFLSTKDQCISITDHLPLQSHLEIGQVLVSTSTTNGYRSDQNVCKQKIGVAQSTNQYAPSCHPIHFKYLKLPVCNMLITPYKRHFPMLTV